MHRRKNIPLPLHAYVYGGRYRREGDIILLVIPLKFLPPSFPVAMGPPAHALKLVRHAKVTLVHSTQEEEMGEHMSKERARRKTCSD